MVYVQAVVVPALSALTILLSITPLILHWQNRNWPTTCLIGWFLILNLFNIINAIIWPKDDLDNWWNGEGLCDVEVKVMIAGYVAVPGCLVCIFRNLASVLDTRRTALVPTKGQRWSNRSMDLLFCLIVPLISMATHIVYQGNRYALWGISGCVNMFDESWVSFMLSWIWPAVICLVAGYYCGFVMYRLHKYRSQFGHILQSSGSNLNKSRFIRLFLLAFVMLLAIIPVQAFVLWKNVMYSMPWHAYSWRLVHSPEWHTIAKWPSNGDVFFDRWVPVTSGFIFFIFFGCGNDASKIYRLILQFLGLRCVEDLSRGSSSSVLDSMNSKARLFVRKRWGSSSRTYANGSTCRSADRNGDLEMGSITKQEPKHITKLPWIRNLLSPLYFSVSHDRGRKPSVPDLSAPTNTICTNAWAGTSKSRASSELNDPPIRKDFIRVKQVISQESELHV